MDRIWHLPLLRTGVSRAEQQERNRGGKDNRNARLRHQTLESKRLSILACDRGHSRATPLIVMRLRWRDGFRLGALLDGSGVQALGINIAIDEFDDRDRR